MITMPPGPTAGDDVTRPAVTNNQRTAPDDVHKQYTLLSNEPTYKLSPSVLIAGEDKIRPPVVDVHRSASDAVNA